MMWNNVQYEKRVFKRPKAPKWDTVLGIRVYNSSSSGLLAYFIYSMILIPGLLWLFQQRVPLNGSEKTLPLTAWKQGSLDTLLKRIFFIPC